MTACSVLPGLATNMSNGDTIAGKAHAKTGIIANLSIIGAEDLVRPNSKECIEDLDILAPGDGRVGCALVS